jgi:hypothetical protein
MKISRQHGSSQAKWSPIPTSFLVGLTHRGSGLGGGGEAGVPATNIIAHGFYLEAKFFALIAWASPDGAHRSYDGIQLFSLKAPHHATQSPHR